MNARRLYFIILIFLSGFLIVDYFFTEKVIRLTSAKNISTQSAATDSRKIDSSVESQSSQPLAPTSGRQLKSTGNEVSSLQQFKSEFKYEVAQVGKTTQDAGAVENRLQSIARQLEPEHIQYLSQVLIDHDGAGDEQAMAVELLSRNQTPQAEALLKDFVIADLNAQEPRHLEQKVIFKAQAIEGIAGMEDKISARKHLDEIIQKSLHSFLIDRAQRAKAQLDGQLRSLESQDNEALKKLIE